MITKEQISLALKQVAGFNLHGPSRVDEVFVEDVRIAYMWCTTSRCRWRRFQHCDLYGIRHHCEYEVGRGLSDKAFAVAASIARWRLHPEYLRPEVLRFRRAQTEA